MVPIYELTFDELLAEAVSFHGHACPGQVLGVRMTQAGCRAVGVPHPRAAGKSLLGIVEIDRCATDAIEALTGVSLGKRTLNHLRSAGHRRHHGGYVDARIGERGWIDETS